MADRVNLPRFENMFKFEGEELYRVINDLYSKVERLEREVEMLKEDN